MQTKICIDCKLPLSVDNFEISYLYKGKNVYRPNCRPCQKERYKQKKNRPAVVKQETKPVFVRPRDSKNYISVCRFLFENYLDTDEKRDNLFFGCSVKPTFVIDSTGGATFNVGSNTNMYIACYKLSNELITNKIYDHSPELAFYPYIQNKAGINFYPTIQRGNLLGHIRDGGETFFI